MLISKLFTFLFSVSILATPSPKRINGKRINGKRINGKRIKGEST